MCRILNYSFQLKNFFFPFDIEGVYFLILIPIIFAISVYVEIYSNVKNSCLKIILKFMQYSIMMVMMSCNLYLIFGAIIGKVIGSKIREEKKKRELYIIP
ncbi:hypothetical protein SLOPH_825 [Spraguea lophii 42_110]|uniref:Uncharacterized protein n=1 Tax=Spraguea lophii (strain 42_110) TaxID=1358809 RepID=S7XTV0_SPRLO|nr:hypothetical protein SLOPH_825 [Spraguea lophii 42_110]